MKYDVDNECSWIDTLRLPASIDAGAVSVSPMPTGGWAVFGSDILPPSLHVVSHALMLPQRAILFSQTRTDLHVVGSVAPACAIPEILLGGDHQTIAPRYT
jgi:hypothetical protein